MKQTRLDRLNPDVTPKEKRRYITWIEEAMKLAEVCPVAIYCDDNEWENFPGEYTLIDAISITLEDLTGTDFDSHSYFYPIWLKDAERTKSIVITNFAQVPAKKDKTDEKNQYDFAHLLRTSDEDPACRELNLGSGIYVPQDIKIFLILKHGEILDNYFCSRCAIIDTREFDN